MGALTKKQFGTIKQAMQGFLGKKSLTFPQSIDEFKVPDAMFRRFKLDDRRLALMTEFGIENRWIIIGTPFFLCMCATCTSMYVFANF